MKHWNLGQERPPKTLKNPAAKPKLENELWHENLRSLSTYVPNK